MKVIGKYRSNEVKVRGLHVEYTYEDYLCLSPNEARLALQHKNIIAEIVSSRASRYFPSHLPVCLVDEWNLNLKCLLPEITVYAWISCPAPIEDDSNDWSELLMIWFQEESDDVFQMASEKFKKIIWPVEARDWAI